MAKYRIFQVGGRYSSLSEYGTSEAAEKHVRYALRDSPEKVFGILEREHMNDDGRIFSLWSMENEQPVKWVRAGDTNE